MQRVSRVIKMSTWIFAHEKRDSRENFSNHFSTHSLVKRGGGGESRKKKGRKWIYNRKRFFALISGKCKFHFRGWNNKGEIISSSSVRWQRKEGELRSGGWKNGACWLIQSSDRNFEEDVSRKIKGKSGREEWN